MAPTEGSDPNMISWSDYMAQNASDNGTTSSDSEDDFRGDSLNDADWEGQSGGMYPRSVF
jgi:hypothetical protein